jgi:hypothetical protein
MSKLSLRTDWERRLKREFDLASEYLLVVTAVREALKGFEGKQITKRLATAAEKVLSKKPDDYVTYYDANGMGWHQLYIWNRNPESLMGYNDRLNLNLGYRQSNKYEAGVYRDAFFNEHNMVPYTNRFKEASEMMQKFDRLRELEKRLTSLDETKARLIAEVGVATYYLE